jgi:hypothetical protein
VASGQLGKSRSLYSLTGATPSVDHAFLSQWVPNLESWHRHLGHTNYRSIVEMARDGVAEGMHIDLSTEPGKCDHCILGKQVRTPVPKTREGPRSKQKLGIVCVDLMGPEAVKSVSGNLYTMNLIDDCIECLWVEVGTQFAQAWKAFFTRLERIHHLDASNPSHLWLLHILFLDVINKGCKQFQTERNSHPTSRPHTNDKSPNACTVSSRHQDISHKLITGPSFSRSDTARCLSG